MKTTLWSILNNNIDGINLSRGIEIPMIQRDYAQGRQNAKAKEIRDIFLFDLHQGMLNVKHKHSPALDLDFIYGVNTNNTFIPLDGQQRLTTLYLIYWYFAFRDRKIDDLKVQLSKFSYEIRPSTSLFLKRLLDGLDESDYRDVFGDNSSFERVLKNKNWYFVVWNHDISIKAILIMLDSIHEVFRKSEITIHDLIDVENPPVTFNFLQISNFGLSDSLYVKMNSRGKPLTSFENLKAELGKFIKESDFNSNYNYSIKSSDFVKEVDVETYFMTKIDNEWSDLFWRYRDSQYLFDEKLLNLLSFISLNVLAINNKVEFDHAIEKFSDPDFQISYYSLYVNNLINESTIISYIDILDLLTIKNVAFRTYLDESGFYEQIILPVFSRKINVDYQIRVLFYGIFEYVRRNKLHLDIIELNKWSRLLHNMTSNTIYNRSSDFIDSLQGICSFLDSYSGDLYKDFLKNSMSGFDSVQTKEEHIKLTLRISELNFNLILDEIENHGYLLGQITGILVISGIVERYNYDKFQSLTQEDLVTIKCNIEKAYSKFIKFFNEKGLIPFQDDLFRRALLTYGDYAVYSTNFCFFVNSGRDVSWKRLLKELGTSLNTYNVARGAFLKLFDNISSSEDTLEGLRNIIKEYLNSKNEEDWLYYFIKYPIILENSYQKYVKFFEGDLIYPLRRTKYFKEEDPDYMSLVLKHKLENAGIDTRTIDFGYIQSGIEQYGIKSILGKSIKIAYNHDRQGKFYIKKHGDEGFYMGDITAVVKYISGYFEK